MSSNPTIKDEVARLTALVEEQGRVLAEQRQRLDELEHRGPDASNGGGNGDSRHSRRDILRLAGLAAAGAAGATALQALPAAAATGGNFVLGQANDANASTVLSPSVAAETAIEGLLEVDGSTTSGATSGLAVNATTNFFRAVRGIAPHTPAANPVSGVGVWGSSDAGAGVVGSSPTGVDLWAFNSGRVMQSSQPAGSPTYQGGVYDSGTAAWTDFEAIRDGNGVFWIFLPASLNGSNTAPTGPTGGTWIPVQPGGFGQTLFTVVTTVQQGLSGNDGATFMDMQPAGGGAAALVLNITPAYDCHAILTGNADLFTNTAGINQDIGIYVNPSGLPAANQNIVAWKESGGFAGTFSPNAAFVQAVVSMSRGTTYNVRLKWKTNKTQLGTIYAGGGPFPAATPNVSPTRLTAQLVIG